ncbi:MAG: deaminase [bacterium]
MKKAIVMYVPALHQGYIDFLKNNTLPGDYVFLLHGKQLAQSVPELEHFNRDLRAITPLVMHSLLEELFQSYDVFGNQAGNRVVKIVSSLDQLEPLVSCEAITMPREDASLLILEKLPQLKSVTTLVDVSLRWDKSKSLLHQDPGVHSVLSSTIDNSVIEALSKEMDKSVDWWRRVACVVFKGKEVVMGAYNSHLPSNDALNIFGDPRFNFSPGEHVECCTAIHAEAALIAHAARAGVSIKGLSMLVSDFPCPTCAKLIAHTGIKELYFMKGYSQVAGKEVLEAAGITLRQITF